MHNKKEILPLVEKYKGIYDGWGTYFEDPNAEDDEYGDDGEFFDDEDVEATTNVYINNVGVELIALNFYLTQIGMKNET